MNKRTFGIKYYDLGKDTVRQQMTLHGLIVFTLEASENFQCNTVELCMTQIIPMVKEKMLPFILCLKHFNINDAGRHRVLLMEAVKILQSSLRETHIIIRTELPPGRLCYGSQRLFNRV